MTAKFKKAICLLLSIMLIAGALSSGTGAFAESAAAPEAKAQTNEEAKAEGGESSLVQSISRAAKKLYNLAQGPDDENVITDGGVVTLTLGPDETGLVNFTCTSAGKYIFWATTLEGYYYSAYIYNSSGGFVGYSNTETYLSAGQTYTLKVRTLSAYDVNVIEVGLSHSHTDTDGDFICDTCNTAYRVAAAEDAPATVNIPNRDFKEFVFTSPRNAKYRLNITYTSGVYTYYVLDENGSYVNADSDGYYLTAGKKYYVRFLYNNTYSASTDVTLTVIHSHTDTDGDYHCDTCDVLYRYAITDGDTVTFSIPKRDSAEVVFVCTATGGYNVYAASTNGNGFNGGSIYNENGSSVYWSNGAYRLTAGNTYLIKYSYAGSYESTDMSVTLKHVHKDDDNDYACDICDAVYRYEIEEDTPLNFTIPSGENRELVFACTASGEYRFSITYTNYLDEGYVYDSDGNEVGYPNSALSLVAGKTYVLKTTFSNNYYPSTDVSATITHVHKDSDGDFICDTCEETYRCSIEDGEVINVTIPNGEMREVVFECGKTGEYMFTGYSDKNVIYDIFKSDGTYPAWGKNGYQMTQGSTYLLRMTFSSSIYASAEATVKVKHIHKDNDNDYDCDICGVTYRCDITEGSTVTVNIPCNEHREVLFACTRTGDYRFSWTLTHGVSDGYIYDPDGTSIGHATGSNHLTAGKTYTVRLSFTDDDYDSTTATVTLMHTHTDADNDYACDICDAVYRYAIADGQTLTLQVPNGDQRLVIFECGVTGQYRFSSTNTNGYVSNDITTSDGYYVGYVGNTLSLTQGKTYIVTLTCIDRYEYSTVKITLNHLHQDSDDNLLCDICSLAYRTAITEGNTVSVNIPQGESREIFFACERTGDYRFITESTNGYSYSYISDADGVVVGYTNQNVSLTAGNTYYFRPAYTYTYNESTDVTVTLKHAHTDADGDFVCDICDTLYRYAITDGVSTVINVPSGDSREAVFVCTETGEYKFSASGTYGYNEGGIYNQDGTAPSYGNRGYSLTAGNTYVIRFSLIDSSYDSTDITVKLTHIHKDDDNDYACDICDTVYRYAIAADSSVTAVVPTGESREFVFSCARSGKYRFTLSGTNGYNNAYIYDVEGNDLGYPGGEINLTEGGTYTLIVDYYSSYNDSTEVTAALKHSHEDKDGDYDCDVCGVTYRYDIEDGGSVTVNIPSGELREFVFACTRTGEYRFSASSDYGYSNAYLYNSNGAMVGSINGAHTLTAGQTYCFRPGCHDYYTSTSVTLSVRHIHEDTDGDYACDICGATYRYDITEGTPLSITIPLGEQREIIFTCTETGKYTFFVWYTHSYSGSTIFNSSGGLVGYVDESILLTAGQTYYFRPAYYETYHDSTALTVTVNHTHVDSDGNYKCDICNKTFRYAITDGESVTVTVPQGENREVVFVPTRTGEYTYSTSSTNGYSGGGIYKSDGTNVGWGGGTYTLTAGETYSMNLLYSNSSNESTDVTVTLKHIHKDTDGDNNCDVCGVAFRYTITEGQTLTFTVPAGEQRDVVFACRNTAKYKFRLDYTNGLSYDIYNSNGEYVGYGGNEVTLTGGQTYYLRLICSTSKASDVKVTVKHIHESLPDSLDCSVCGLRYRVPITEDGTVQFSVPAGDFKEAFFTCQREGYYIFNVSSDHSVSTGVYNSYGSYMGSSNSSIYMSAGQIYFLRAEYSDSQEGFASVTVKLKHAHNDTDGDYKCDICDRVIAYDAQEDVPLAVNLPGSDYVTVYFTPDRDADFFIKTSGCYVNEVRNQTNGYVDSSYDSFNRNYAYSLSEGVRYKISIRNNSSDDKNGKVTITHAHIGETTTVVEPTAASMGVDGLTCTYCGKTVYATTSYTGEFVTIKENNGFYYAVLEDDEGNKEATVMYYAGDDTDVVIPSSIEGVPVTSIISEDGPGFLLLNPSITSVAIPDTVRTIGRNTFMGATGLTEIIIPDSVTVIDEMAFYGCTNLETVTIGTGVKYIGPNAFELVLSAEERAEISEDDLPSEEELEEMIAEEAAYLERELDEFFADISAMTNTEITDWDDFYDYAENADEDEIAEIFHVETREQLIEQINQYKASMDMERMYIGLAVAYYRNLPATYQALTTADTSPLENVIYGGSEQDWANVTVDKGNEQLEDATWTYSGETPADLFVLTYDANGGTGAPASHTGNGTATVSATKPEREGYLCIGWSESSAATEAQYTAGDELTLDRNITLYAVWQEHEHSYTESLVKEPTCTKKGLKTFTCECGDTYDQPVPALGHDPVPHEGKASTCEEQGYKPYETCTRCDYTTYEELPLAAHTPGEAVTENRVESTCTVAGSYDSVVKCTVCGAEISRDKIDLELAEHTPGDAVTENRVESTCTVAGSYDSVVKCSVCGAEISREKVDLPLAAHTPGNEITIENEVESTCTVAGSFDCVVNCSVCGAEISREKVDLELADHTPGEEIRENEVASTCKVAGSYDSVVKCSVCGEELSREKIDLELAEHTPAEAVRENEVASTCTVAGSYDSVVKCSVCGEEISREKVDLPLAEHTPAEVVRENEVASTCKTAGSYDSVVKCSVCGEELSREKVDLPLGDHTPGDPAVENSTTSTCEVAGEYDSVIRCSVCGVIISSEHKIKELGEHAPLAAVKENEVAATHTQGGSYESVVYCGVCGDVLSRETITTDPLGHSYTPVVTPATCTEGGYTTYTCSCGDSYRGDETPKLGHSFTNYVYNNDATADRDGTETAKCDRCTATDTRRKPGTKLTPEYSLPERFNDQTADYKTIVTVSVTLYNVPADAVVYIDGKPADVNGNTYSAKIGQLSSSRDVKVEVRYGNTILSESTLSVKVGSSFINRLSSFFKNFLFNMFKWKEVTVRF